MYSISTQYIFTERWPDPAVPIQIRTLPPQKLFLDKLNLRVNVIVYFHKRVYTQHFSGYQSNLRPSTWALSEVGFQRSHGTKNFYDLPFTIISVIRSVISFDIIYAWTAHGTLPMWFCHLHPHPVSPSGPQFSSERVKIWNERTKSQFFFSINILACKPDSSLFPAFQALPLLWTQNYLGRLPAFKVWWGCF